jgi:hypothetical protein
MQGQLAKRLVAVEIIAKQGDAMRRYRLGMPGNPAFARHALTVLFDLTILRHDEFRR